ncbi:TetR/AcrR family transcriptional regulator [Pseudonocardia sp. DSM 110487]|uniref:TetR/AcrR family transcriptional regulator n=1 Tax=Pseudonocardia sp. DSM 110487 TaxID=2865833 RepID=UPI001C698EFD|nr:TetR/AcrR family transcriptional regulator [Pseudonocardia sp. DSM 110487]QYN32163.1 TetR/AcrR family transcriptional regulator [Pseudonocardia sp. DSM 110487]
MSKGEATRGVILGEASRLARRIGLGGLTIGSLATQTGMSKSGLFAHFGSKESLQLQVLEHSTERFVDEVIRPAVKAPRGVPRVRDLFERWLEWDSVEGGCPLAAASFELDDQPGPVRDHLVRVQRDWADTLATVFTSGIGEGHFRPDTDPRQFAQDVLGVMLAFHLASRLLADPSAADRARRALDTLLAAAAD